MEEGDLSCPSKSCVLKFQTESQLRVHARKHDMILTLNKGNVSTIDQTPTPTRFIRNCEEIGLFQDLQNVNPFEETFRKAAENVKKGGSHRSESPSFLSKPAGDDLHTPHLFPEVQQEITINNENECSEEVVIRSEADTSLKPITPQPSPPTLEGQKNESNEDPVQVILKLPSGGFIQLSTKPLQAIPVNNSVSLLPSLKANNSTVILTPTTEVIQELTQTKPVIQNSPDVKSKLKAFLGGSTKAPANFNISPDSKSSNSKPSRKRNSSPSLKKIVSESVEDDALREKRQKVLERNREAAYRCRAKRKKWVEELVRRADQMSNANRALIHEVSSLKEEVARLKGLLLAHANCPITLAANAQLEFTAHKTAMNLNRERLTLSLEKAAENEIMDLDSPSLVVKKDEVLSAAAPPSTPDERIVTFPELDRDDLTEVSLEDKLASSSIGTTVIQINPNVLKNHSFS
ncbi:cyclic AMP-dependent transcription factor ATF-2 isoform X2 [Cimex lectularius]|uniref:BZIP domain-containing protein n=1 Tax=Cimex lectularius TaxID=79782 RepID=A0A8I6RLA5_CIMLE|nr:cyclic AMP-dependent transcription factor ATF-2 isoform X2 [Cimex lectularius]